ncbi:hypothetical protein [Patiriisocius marinus]|uniref:hypothetical protein n=1 Tax=Patiriisocius marinus TaxID=1397112 RepID=UPI0023311E17|nr:hypothetical protein [Patiriisocius marinus]
MKSQIFIYLFLIFSISAIAQVGINTNDPKVSLHVLGVNDEGAVTGEDGILVPRVSDLAIDGTENGQLVFLIADITDGAPTPTVIMAKGFYFWNEADSVWSAIDTDTSEWTYDASNTYTFANRPNANSNNIVVTDDAAVYINTDSPTTATQVYALDKLFVNGSTTINEGTLRVLRTNLNSNANTFTMIDISGLAGYGPKFTYRMATQGFAGTREMGGIVARLVDNNDVTRSSKMDFYTYNANTPNSGFQSGIMINDKGNVGLFKKVDQDIPSIDATNKLHVKDLSSDPLRVEGLNASTSTGDKTLVITSTGVVKTATSSSSYSETTSGVDFIATMDNHTIRVVDNTLSVRLPAPSAANAGKIFVLIGMTTNTTLVPIQDAIGSPLSITDDVAGIPLTVIAASTRYTIQSTGTEYIVIGI